MQKPRPHTDTPSGSFPSEAFILSLHFSHNPHDSLLIVGWEFHVPTQTWQHAATTLGSHYSSSNQRRAIFIISCSIPDIHHVPRLQTKAVMLFLLLCLTGLTHGSARAYAAMACRNRSLQHYLSGAHHIRNSATNTCALDAVLRGSRAVAQLHKRPQ